MPQRCKSVFTLENSPHFHMSLVRVAGDAESILGAMGIYLRGDDRA